VDRRRVQPVRRFEKLAMALTFWLDNRHGI
jgi:hypothetical protein